MQERRPAIITGSLALLLARGLQGLALLLVLSLASTHASEPPRITTFDRSGALAWTNATTPAIATVETAAVPGSAWTPVQNAFCTSSVDRVTFPVGPSNCFVRLCFSDVSATSQGFTNLIRAYGLLETAAGTGVGRVDDVSYWESSFEGAAAASAALSRPHYAMVDRAGNIYIADKNSHSVLRVATNGLIYTHAGTHTGGFNGEGPDTATNVQLNAPNALWVRADGTVYVLDTDNARVRRVTTNGIMCTLFYAKNDPSSALGGGRCLWVNDDETLAYFGNTDRIRKWTPSKGLQTLATGFSELGTFCVEPGGDLIVADRGANYVYRVTAAGSKSVIAGNGSQSGGGDGSSALSTGFYGPRGVWPVPTGGYLLLLHDGAQLWYIDAANIAHLLLVGLGGNVYVHDGDGEYFYQHDQYQIGEGRSVTMDSAGNIILCESDYGFIRRIRFQRMQASASE